MEPGAFPVAQHCFLTLSYWRSFPDASALML
jgi:hypothetical protein